MSDTLVIGDKVVYTGNISKTLIGQTGTIILDCHKETVKVAWDNMPKVYEDLSIRRTSLTKQPNAEVALNRIETVLNKPAIVRKTLHMSQGSVTNDYF